MTHHHGWVIQTQNAMTGEPLFWRNGHQWMPLRQATIFMKKNDAISKAVLLGSHRCVVCEAGFSVGRIVYPPSKADG